MIDYQDFKELLRIKKWNQRQLCAEIDINPSSMSRFISAGEAFPGEWIMVIRDVLELTPAEVNWLLLGGDRPPLQVTQRSPYEVIGRELMAVMSKAQNLEVLKQ